MSDNQKFQIAVPSIDNGVVTVEQHGMLYPDNTYQWEVESTARHTIYFADLALGRPATKRAWEDALKVRAQGANIDPDSYAEQHQLVKRTITVVAGKIEEV